MPEIGDVVLCREGEKTYNAIVLGKNDSLITHLGSDSEPTLHVVFVLPQNSHLAGTSKVQEAIRIEYDVVHESHEFDDEYRRQHGAYAGSCRWSEVPKPTQPAASFTFDQIDEALSYVKATGQSQLPIYGMSGDVVGMISFEEFALKKESDNAPR